jgi:hypothetical protein
VTQVLRALSAAVHLARLNLSFLPEGANDHRHELARLLPKWTSLERLALSGAGFLDCSVDPQGTLAVLEAVGRCRQLRKLRLDGTCWSMEDIDVLVTSLRALPLLRRLTFRHSNNEDGYLYERPTDLLTEPGCAVEDLHLCDTSSQESDTTSSEALCEDGPRLARLIRAAHSLRRLRLNRVGLEDVDARVLADAFEARTPQHRLETFELHNTRMTRVGHWLLSRAMWRVRRKHTVRFRMDVSSQLVRHNVDEHQRLFPATSRFHSHASTDTMPYVDPKWTPQPDAADSERRWAAPASV